MRSGVLTSISSRQHSVISGRPLPADEQKEKVKYKMPPHHQRDKRA